MWILAAAAPTIIVNPPSGEGLQTLGAVLLGALITGVFTYLVARYREHASAAARRRRHDVKVMRAARLIDADLSWARAAAQQTVEKPEWWYSGRPLTWKGWLKYRDVIAPELSATDWKTVMVAVTAIDHLQIGRDGAARIHRANMITDPATADTAKAAKRLGLDVFEPIPTRLSDADIGRIEPILRDLEHGRAALAPLVQDKPT